MNAIVVEVPAMYGDHHVLRVRQALLGVEGVDEVTASAARRRVAVGFDETITSAESIRAALEKAGYTPDEMIPAPLFPQRHKDGSAWFTVLERKTTTELKDREMAGDFRRY
jgi:copper chaperone CopZ